jgi:hypothetical protein
MPTKTIPQLPAAAALALADLFDISQGGVEKGATLEQIFNAINSLLQQLVLTDTGANELIIGSDGAGNWKFENVNSGTLFELYADGDFAFLDTGGNPLTISSDGSGDFTLNSGGSLSITDAAGDYISLSDGISMGDTGGDYFTMQGYVLLGSASELTLSDAADSSIVLDGSGGGYLNFGNQGVWQVQDDGTMLFGDGYHNTEYIIDTTPTPGAVKAGGTWTFLHVPNCGGYTGTLASAAGRNVQNGIIV